MLVPIEEWQKNVFDPPLTKRQLLTIANSAQISPIPVKVCGKWRVEHDAKYVGRLAANDDSLDPELQRLLS
ncbi:hypothetical protein HPX47_001676 [Vibrio alginolyticus]|nr:hypothetical protein [Vibrio alginolyticus]